MSQEQYTPYTLNVDQVRLFDNVPSDDYQRLYFNNYLLKQHNKSNNTNHDLDLSIKQNDYKSNIVNIFNNPPYLSNKIHDTVDASNSGSNNNNNNNNLRCFEYQLPDVDVSNRGTEIHENLIDSTPYILRGSIKTWNDNEGHGHTDLEFKENFDRNNNAKVIKKSQIKSRNDNEKLVITKRSFNSNNNNNANNNSTTKSGFSTAATIITSGDTIKTQGDNKSIYNLNTKTGDISLSSNQNLTSLQTSLNPYYSFHDSTTAAAADTTIINALKHNNIDDINQNNNTLTKNQQFKLTKMNYNSISNSNLINPNNCILWDKNTGYVFVTGIWRLYQDIMNGLSSIDRLSTNFKNDHIYIHSDDLKEKCRLELDHILNYAFYEPISWDGKQTRRRKSSLGSFSSGNGTDSQKKDVHNDGTDTNKKTNVENKIVEYPHYVDLHWNNLSKDLKQLILDDFQKMLDKKYPGKHIANLDMSLHIIQRIRGGYIKIQGTWLPWTVARLMCTRFCFPIRWLLVPLFGPQFPKECEDYYFNIMLKNMKYIEQNSLNLSKKDSGNPKKLSTRSRRNTYSGVSTVTKNTTSFTTSTTPTRTRQRKKRHSTTNIPPSISPTEEQISPRTKRIDLKTSNDSITGFPPQFIPKVSRRRSKSDFGINSYMNCNPMLSSTILSSSPTSASSNTTTTNMPSSLPPIKSVFEQIDPYDVSFLASPNTLFNPGNNINTIDNNNQSFVTRPRLNSLPCPSITNPNKYYINNYSYIGSNPHSGVSALSNLAMFYNSRGHRYSYSKNFTQPRISLGNDENTNASAVTTTTHNINDKNNTMGMANSPTFLSYGVSTSESFYTDNNGVNYNSNYKWFTGSRKH